MASDAYFPFPDGIQAAASAGVTAIIQPGGSIRDEMAIEVADRHHLAMVFTGADGTSGTDATRDARSTRTRRTRMRWNNCSRWRWCASPRRRRSRRRGSMGRGDRHGADQLATEAMRQTMDEIDFAGRIVIGEGERDEAPMLYIGEEVGRAQRDPDATRRRHRGRPARGHEPRRPRPGGRDHGPRRVGDRRADPRARHLHGEAVRRPGRRGQGRHPRDPDREPAPDRRGARPPASATSPSSSSSGRATTP